MRQYGWRVTSAVRACALCLRGFHGTGGSAESSSEFGTQVLTRVLAGVHGI